MNKEPFLVILMIAILFFSLLSAYNQVEGQSKPLYVMFIWHYHQPWYYNENDSYFILPWVRMHTVGNYYKMGYILSKYSDIKVTFTFSGSLLVQLLDYLNGRMDYRELISWKIANGSSLSIGERFSMLQIPGGFFDINWNRIVNVVPKYLELKNRALQALQKYKYMPEPLYEKYVVSEFNDQDFIDLGVLFNLFWMDPLVIKEQYPSLYQLRQNALSNSSIHFTQKDLTNVLNAHIDLMSKMIPLYKSLIKNDQAELIPVPYSHPLAPILTDFGWSEDLGLQVEKSLQLFNATFNYKPSGVWPAEQAINDYVLNVFAHENFTWTVTDQTLLSKSGVSDERGIMVPWYATFDTKKIYLFFRDTELSNLISFTYSNLDSQQAVNDLVNRLLNFAKLGSGNNVIVIALDGENPWENYAFFGDTFLNQLYSTLENYQRENLLITITPSEYLRMFNATALPLSKESRMYLDLAGRDISDVPINYFEDAYQSLPRKSVTAYISEGSWAGGELALWIGQRQENVAWMLLSKARDDIFRILNVTSIKEAYIKNNAAVENLFRAEASDWFWWYGGDGGGTFPANPLFKGYLQKIYTSLGIEPPQYLLTMFNPDATPIGTINTQSPQPIDNRPKIDGVIESNEWGKSLNMSIGISYIKNILIAVDPDYLYIAVIPVNVNVFNDPTIEIGVYLTNPWRSVSPYNIEYNAFSRYGNVDLGIGLFYEILIKPYSNNAIINIADGKGNWIKLFRINEYAKGNVIEMVVPWNFMNLRSNDFVYITAATYRNKSLVEDATRLGSTYFIQVPKPKTAPVGKVLFDMNDPEGDDNGLGTYQYPKNDVFKPGVFDLVRFKVTDSGDKLIFTTYLKNLGGNPWNGPNGFSLQYIQIYVHTTLNISGNVTTFGLNVDVSNDSAWHFALLLAPGWGSDPVPAGEKAALYYYNGTVVIQDNKFKVYADQSENAIIAEVSKELLLDLNNSEKWIYTVVVTSYDGYGPQRIRPFGVNPDEWTVGVGQNYAQAIVRNVIPRIMDLLAPSKEDQYSMLKSFVISSNITKPVIIRGYSAGLVSSATITTSTITTTVTNTVTTTKIVNTTLTTTSIINATKTVQVTQIPIESQISTFIMGLILGIIASSIIIIIRRHRVS
ncbi:MAG: glucodextranase DOMON-like domain-containing protein [Thermoprotei archaeon]